MAALDLDRIWTLEDFAGRVGEIFYVGFDDGTIVELVLREAEALSTRGARPENLRPPFRLSFLTQDPRILPQQVYGTSHAELGHIPLFLVASGKDERGVFYEVTFN